VTTFGALRNFAACSKGVGESTYKGRRQSRPQRLEWLPRPEYRGVAALFANRKWQRIALSLNLLGMVLLFLSFQATSSNFRFVTTPDNKDYICIQNEAFFMHPHDGGFSMGSFPCPQDARAAAIVNAEHPSFIFIGFACSALGFLLQLLSIPSSKTIAEIRAELKKAQLEERLKARNH
jgi:hypothetical protein